MFVDGLFKLFSSLCWFNRAEKVVREIKER